MCNKIVIVTGAHGFIGRHVSRQLAKNGWKVIGIGHGKWQSLEEQFAWGLSEWYLSDVSIEALRQCAVSPYAIVHCSGSSVVGLSLERPKEDFERSVATTLNVMEFARQYAPTAKIVTMSSAGVYGEVECLPIRETDPLNPISPYGVHKKMAEEICRCYTDHFGLTVSVLRLFSVYGSGLRKQLLWDACNKISRGEHIFFGTGNELRDWIHVSDVALLVESSMTESVGKFSVYNGATGSGVTVEDVLTSIYENLDVSGKPSFSGLTKPGDPPGYIGDTTKVKNALAWNAIVPWKDGILEYVEWFKRNEID